MQGCYAGYICLWMLWYIIYYQKTFLVQRQYRKRERALFAWIPSRQSHSPMHSRVRPTRPSAVTDLHTHCNCAALRLLGGSLTQRGGHSPNNDSHIGFLYLRCSRKYNCSYRSSTLGIKISMYSGFRDPTGPQDEENCRNWNKWNTAFEKWEKAIHVFQTTK